LDHSDTSHGFRVRMSVQQFQIIPEKQTYWAGETVRGTLLLRTSGPISCRGVRLKLEGKGYCYWREVHHNDGEREVKEFRHRKLYVEHAFTVFGSVVKTSVLDEAGSDVQFGRTPGQGDLYLPIDMDARPDPQIIVRLLDYDWGLRDDLLGEVLVDVMQLTTTSAGGNALTFPLSRKGHAEQGSVTLSAVWMDTFPMASAWGHMQNVRTLKVTLVSASDLRSGEWFGKNDVYAQVYSAPPDMVAGKAFPEGVEKVELPPGEISCPFEFQLPVNLPSSFEGSPNRGHSRSQAWVRYSLYSNVDIAWKFDPSARTAITVVQPLAVMPKMLVPRIHEDSKQIGCLCCIAGDVTFYAKLDRGGMAPGETAFVHVHINNASSREGCTIKLSLEQGATLYARKTREISREWMLGYFTLAPQTEFDHVVPLRIPAGIPPSYSGGFGEYRRDPVVWDYNLDVHFDIPWSFDMHGRFPVTICGVGLPMMPALAGAGGFEYNVPSEPVPAFGPDPLVGFDEAASFGASLPTAALVDQQAGFTPSPYYANVSIKDQDESAEDEQAITLDPYTLAYPATVEDKAAPPAFADLPETEAPPDSEKTVGESEEPADFGDE